MNLNKEYISNNNSYPNQKASYIVIHNTDNYSAGADAKAHARAQHDGNFNGMSAHIYVDDKSAYQAMPFDRGAWHVGVNYGGRLFGTVNNRNSIGIEMCVQAGFGYEKAFQNTIAICMQIMSSLGISPDHVVQHFDVCAKNCPSEIRARNDWKRFKQAIEKNAENSSATNPTVSGKTKADLTGEISIRFPEISRGCTGTAVSMLQSFLEVDADGIWGADTDHAFKSFQKNTNQLQDGICGKNGWTAIVNHMKENTFRN